MFLKGTRTILVLILILGGTVQLFAGGAAENRKEQESMTAETTDRDNTGAEMPPIDKNVPVPLENAVFALG